MKPLPERWLLLLLAAVQFTHIVDFMILMPLRPQLNAGSAHRRLTIQRAWWRRYTISSGIVGLCIAAFVDRFDRRKFLLFAYAGFIVGTLTCALSQKRHHVARGPGVLRRVRWSVDFDGDVHYRRRRAGGTARDSHGDCDDGVFRGGGGGIPFGLKLAQLFRWEAPFFLLPDCQRCLVDRLFPAAAGSGSPERWPRDRGRSPNCCAMPMPDGRCCSCPCWWSAILPSSAVVTLSRGQRRSARARSFLVYFTGGVLTVFTAPRIGRLADRLGRFRVFSALVAVACVVTLIITNSGPLPVWAVLVLGGSFLCSPVDGSCRTGDHDPGRALVTPRRVHELERQRPRPCHGIHLQPRRLDLSPRSRRDNWPTIIGSAGSPWPPG